MPAARPLNIVVLANNPCDKDARIIKSAEAAAAAGHRVTIFARNGARLPRKQLLNGVEYLRFGRSSGGSHDTNSQRSARPPARPIPRFLLTALRRSFFTTAALLIRNMRSYSPVASSLKPDIVHAHDLHTLLAGWSIARKSGARLVYDSHELEVGRNGNFSAFAIQLIAISERFLIKRTDAVITVSDSIANYLGNCYRIARPIVIHNTPKSSLAPAKDVEDIRSVLSLEPSTKLVVYIGAVTFNRGLEFIVDAMPLMPDVHVALVGPRNHADTEAQIRRRAAELGVSRRLHLVDPVPSAEVTRFVHTADASLALIQDTCLSYRFSFPNKLLESLFARVPVVASKLPEYERLISRTNAGITVDQSDTAAIAAGIKKLLANRAAYLPSPEGITELTREFGWDSQVVRLLNLYEQLRSSKPSVDKAQAPRQKLSGSAA